MKLRARFPQIGLVRAEAPSGSLRRTFWPTSRSGGAALPEPAVPAAPAPAPAPAPTFTPITTSEFAPPQDWPSTVAAWRSTTGKPADRT